ncbi:hypothetical protein VQ643_03595 [Pseudomonas sp. F1_0610]|uniref:hypothetical protein n=1 Tax=Pseudomonas sp. F1_0610 TaxID=3114284 RepID=UPI0039C1FDEE
MPHINLCAVNNAQSQAMQNLTGYVRIEQFSSIAEIIQTYQQLKAQHPTQAVLLILDDQNQCDYTSWHCIECLELAESEAEVDYADPNYPLHLLPAIRHLLQQTDIASQWASMAEKTEHYSAADWKSFLAVNHNPLPTLKKSLLVRMADLPNTAEKLAITPNGYFTCDFNPFENYAIIESLTTEFGYEFLGLGAALLGFIKTERFSNDKAKEVIQRLKQIYPLPEDIAAQMQELIIQQDYLFLFYTESPEDYLYFYS